MTTTNMFLNFGGKWDSPPGQSLKIKLGSPCPSLKFLSSIVCP